MAGQLEGDQYISLDDAIFGGGSGTAGTSDATTRPLSTYVENRLDANLKNLLGRGQSATYSFFTTAGDGTRRHASYHDRFLLWVPWFIYPSMTRIRVKYWGSIRHDNGNTTGKVEMAAHLRNPQGGTYESPRTEFANTGSDPAVREMEIDLSNLRISSASLGFVALEYSSAANHDPGNSGTVTRVGSGQSYFLEETGTTTHVANSTVTSFWDRVKTHQVDLYHKDTPDSGGTACGIARWDRNPQQCRRMEMSYLQPRAVSIRAEHDRSSTIGAIEPKTPASMRAQQPVLGQEVSLHGVNLDEFWDRPRLLATGPQGESENGVGWPGRQYRKWSWVYAGTRSGGQQLPATADRQIGWIAEDEQTISVVALVAFFRSLKNPDLFIPQGVYKSGIDEDGDLEAESSVADVEFAVEAEQLRGQGVSGGPDTSWSDATRIGANTETKREIRVMPSAKVRFMDLLSQFYFARYPEGLGDQQHILTDDYEYGFKEGSMRKEDFELGAQLVRLSMDLDSTPTPDDPIRMNFSLRGIPSVNHPADTYDTEDYTMICLQTSWYSRTRV